MAPRKKPSPFYSKYKKTIYIIGSILTVSLLLIFFYIFQNEGVAPSRNLIIESGLESRNTEYKTKIRNLENKITEITLKNTNLQVRVGELSVDDPNGLAIEEKRKALDEKEALFEQKKLELSEREARVIEHENETRIRENKHTARGEQFVIDRSKEYKSMGAAEELKKIDDKRDKEISELKDEKKELKADNEKIANRLNNWHIFFSIAILFLIIAILSVIVLYPKYRKNEGHIDSAIKILETNNIPIEDKMLLAKALGKPISYQNQKDDRDNKTQQ